MNGVKQIKVMEIGEERVKEEKERDREWGGRGGGKERERRSVGMVRTEMAQEERGRGRD